MNLKVPYLQTNSMMTQDSIPEIWGFQANDWVTIIYNYPLKSGKVIYSDSDCFFFSEEDLDLRSINY